MYGSGGFVCLKKAWKRRERNRSIYTYNASQHAANVLDLVASWAWFQGLHLASPLGFLAGGASYLGKQYHNSVRQVYYCVIA